MAINLNIRSELPEDSIVFDNFSYDNAIVGYTTDNRVVYDYDRMIEELILDEDFSYEDAAEWIDYNTIRSLSYVNGNAPIIMYKL